MEKKRNNTPLSICFLARPVHSRYSPILYKALKKNHEQNLFGGFISSNRREVKSVRKALNGYEDDTVVYEVSSYFKEHWDEFTYEKFLEYEKKYDCKPIWNLIYMDRFLICEDYDYCVKITAGYFQFFEKIFNETHYDFYYDECISTLQSYLAYIVGMKMGVRYFTQTAPRGGMDGEYHIMVDNPKQYISGFHQNYKTIEYSEEERKKADAYLTKFEKRDIVPMYQARFKEEPKFNPRYLLAPLRYVRSRFDPYSNDKYFYMYKKAWEHCLDMEKFYFRYKKSRKYYHEADLSKKYVYFPLHYQPESTTLVCASKYEKQLYYIDSWAKSLPGDTMLYVKEHYTLVGNRELSFYEELKKYPNVVVISPWESSRGLINHAQAIITLTGTVGFEAMLLRKPVIVSGDALFDMAPGVVKEPEPYQKYISIMNHWRLPEREVIIQYLCEYFRCMYEGCANVWLDEAYEEENIRKLASAVYMYMSKMRSEII